MALSSSVLLLLAAPPEGVPLLACVALVPLLSELQRSDGGARCAAVLGWLCGAGFYAGLVPWLVPTIGRMQQVSTPIAVTCDGLFVAYHALQFAIAALTVWWFRPLAARQSLEGHSSAGVGPIGAAVVVAAVWVLSEWAFPKVFVWGLGAALGPNRVLRQVADLGGVYLLTAVVVAINALLASRRPAAALCAVALLATCTGYGEWRLAAPGAAEPDALRVGVVQAGSTVDADARVQSESAWTQYAAASQPLAERAAVIVWPESVLRAYLAEPGEWRDHIEALARRLRRPLILGGLDHAEAGQERNAVFAFAPRLTAVRHKRELVPFGEYVPGARWLSWLDRWRVTGRFAPGEGSAPLDTIGSRAAVAVCVEAIRPGAFNAPVRAGAQWLLNLTDDSWFASRRAAVQHLEMARLRAVETRRWLLRASHSGISAAIDPNGEIVAALPFAAAGMFSQVVAPRDGLTLYVRVGNWPVAAAALVVIAAAAVMWSRHRAVPRPYWARRDRTAALPPPHRRAA